MIKTWHGIAFAQGLAKRTFGNPSADRMLLRRCALAALLLVLCVFPDVVFMHASLSNASLVNVTSDDGYRKVQLFPERRGREAYEGYYDPGGGAFQSEPGAQFVRRSLREGQSIYWNPYSATGSYGPETLVDIKTSPVSMITALFDGGDVASHLVFLSFNLLAVFCLLLLFTIEFRLSFLAAIGGGVTYLLNGYYMANLGSNVSQVWLYFPVLTLALVSFARRPSAMKLVAIQVGAMLVLATTFLPTMIVTLATALLVGATASVGHSLVHERGMRSISGAAARLIAGQLTGVALGLLTLAILYLPLLEALDYMATGEFYAGRNFYPAYLFNLISLFTPKHAFEAYNAITARADSLRGNATFHQGIIGALLASQVVRSWPVLQRTVIAVVTGVLLVIVARIYGLPVLTPLVNAIPVVGNLGEQYVWISVGLLFTILVAFGLHGLLVGGVRPLPLLIVAAVIGSALAYTTIQYGLENVVFVRYLWVTVSILAVGLALILSKRKHLAPVVVALCLVVLSWGELTFYVDHVRLHRYDRFSNPAPFIRFLQKQGGLYRIASYGPSGIPPEYGSAFGLYQIESMNFQLFPRYVDIFNRLVLPNPKHRWTGFITMVMAPDVGSLNLPAFDFLGVKYLVTPSGFSRLHQFMERSGWSKAYSDPGFVIFENPNPLPRSFIVHQVSEGSDTPLDIGKSPRAVATSDDPILIAEAVSNGLVDATPQGPADTEQAQITRYGHTRVEISANVARTGLLVLNDAWHPNWRVWVDGTERHLARVNGAFRGVLLSPGTHVVDMRYAPRTFTIGKILSITGLAGMLLLVLFRRRIDLRWMRLIFAPHTQSTKVAQTGNTPRYDQFVPETRELQDLTNASAGTPAASQPTSIDKLPSFCIALPVYNEAAGIENCITGIAAFLQTVPSRTAIIAIDDGSRDETWDILLRLQRNFPSLILERHVQNGGYGEAQRTLCRLASENKFEYALVMDADGTQAPHFIGNFFEPMRGGIDFVKATRYDKDGSVEGVPWQRYWISRLGNQFAHLVMGLPVTDFSNGFRAIRTDAWQKLATTERNFVVLIEEVYLAGKLGLTFAEVPYVLSVRKEPGSKSKFTYNWGIYRQYLRYVFKK